MTYGQRCTASAELAGQGEVELRPSQWTTTDGSAITSNDAVIIREVSFESDWQLRRELDVGNTGSTDATIQINEATGSVTLKNLNLITSQKAFINANDNSGSSQTFTAVGEVLDGAKRWVELGDVSSGGTLTRQIASRNSEETLYEVVYEDDFTLRRKEDIDDDGTFESSVAIESSSAGASGTKNFWYPECDNNGTNPRLEWELTNDSSNTRTFALIGTIGSEY